MKLDQVDFMGHVTSDRSMGISSFIFELHAFGQNNFKMDCSVPQGLAIYSAKI